ncbi:MAG: 1-(5-phosphoribosyl)-5-[(5-phosphoribosylamino)methylideneamino]imidazole-4-carboxamide isomerase [Vulcanibacillus sp.]
MILIPAIDIKDNKCVRLTQGDFNRVTVYSNDPSEMAEKWVKEGAEYLHLVDLDGARTEEFINRPSIEKIIHNLNIPIQIGGGIRSKGKVANLLKLGVSRVIVGTIAIENRELLKQLVAEYGDKIVVSIDAKDGYVAVRGWEVISSIESIELCQELEAIGVKTIVYTDISKDGMLEGPNFNIYRELSEKTSLNIIASGGVSSIPDLVKLNGMNIYGAIIGKALYDNRVDFKEAIQCLQKG